MKFKLIVTLSVIFFSVFAQASVSPLPVKTKFFPGQLRATNQHKKNLTDFDLNWSVPENYLQWTFRIVNTNTSVVSWFSTDGINSIGVLGYIPAGHYLVEFYSNYYLGPFQYFNYYACWGGIYLGPSNIITAYEVDFTESCNELSVTR